MKDILKLSAKSVLIPLGFTAAASATDAAIKNKIHRSGTTKFTISNAEEAVLVLSAWSGSIFIALFATVIWAPVRITRASLSLMFSVSTRIAK